MRMLKSIMYEGPCTDHMEWEYRIGSTSDYTFSTIYIGVPHVVGVSNRPIEFKSVRKTRPCLNCLQKLDKFLLARARKIFVSARMPGLSLMAKLGNIREQSRAMVVSGNMPLQVLLTRVRILRERSRHPQRTLKGRK